MASKNTVSFSVFTALDSLKFSSRELNPCEDSDIINMIDSAVEYTDKALSMLDSKNNERIDR